MASHVRVQQRAADILKQELHSAQQQILGIHQETATESAETSRLKEELREKEWKIKALTACARESLDKGLETLGRGTTVTKSALKSLSEGLGTSQSTQGKMWS